MMFNFQNLPDSQPTVVRTSFLWWLGFGMKLMFFSNMFTIRKGFKQRSFDYKNIHSVQVDRRFFRGTTLVVQPDRGKTVYFRMTKRQALKAQQHIQARVANKVFY